MIENELKNIWENSSREELVKLNKTKLILDLDSNLESFDRRIKNRNGRSMIGSILVIVGNTYVFFSTSELLIKIACLIAISWVSLQTYLITNVKKYKVGNCRLPLKEYLLKHKEYLIKERNIVDTVIYWKILPIIVMCTLFLFGLNARGTDLIITILLCIGVLVFIYFFNRWGVKNRFDPIIKKLDAIINDLDTIE